MKKRNLLLMLLLAIGLPWVAMGQQALPYSYGFEDNDLATDGWTLYGSTSSSTKIYSESDAPEGSYLFKFQWTEQNAHLVSPLLSGTENGVDVTFQYMRNSSSSSYNEKFQVGYTTDETVTDPTQFTYGNEVVSGTQWLTYENTFPAGTKRIAIKYIYINGYYLRLDDFHFNAAASCAKPTNLECTAYTATTATLGWTENGTATNWVIEYGTASDFTGATSVPVSDNPHTLTGLTAETTYYARVKADCGGGDQSDWSNTCEFKPSAAIIIGTGTSTSGYAPLYGNYNNSYDQMIYTASQLGLEASEITNIGFNSSAANANARTITIYMGHTTKSSFSSDSDFVSINDLTEVYSGTWNITAGWNEFELTTHFDYDGSSNLVIALYSKGSYKSTTFYYTATSGNQVVYAYSDSNDPNPNTYEGNWGNFSYRGTTTRLPNLKLLAEVSSTPKPRNLQVTEKTSESATLTWEAPANATPMSYLYHYKKATDAYFNQPIDNGHNLSVTLNELAANTEYNFGVYANYSEGMSDYAEITFTTEASCLPPTGLHVASLTATSVTIAWDAEEDALYQVSFPGGQPTNPFDPTTPPENSMDDWGWNTQPETGGTASWNNRLTPQSHYGVWVRRYCGPNEFSDPISIEFDTPCDTYDIPYTYDFEDAAPFECWTVIAGAAIQNNSNQAHESTYALKFSGTTNNMVALPQFVNTTNTLRLEFWTRPESATNSNCGNFAVGYMTDLADANSFVAVKTYAYDDWTSAVFEKKTVDFANAPENAYIAMRQYNNSTSWYWFVDDVTVKEIPSCLAPSALAADASATSAELSWTANSGESAWTLYWKKTTDESYTEVADAANPYTLEDLTPATDYQFYVVANCSADDASEPSEVLTFGTSCANITSYPWSENFDSYSASSNNYAAYRDLPRCWNFINDCSYSLYMYYPSMLSYEPSSYAHSGSNYMRFFSYYNSWSDYDPQPQYAILPIMENLAGKEITLWVKGYDATSLFKVGLMTTLDASTFVEITNDDNPAISTSYQQFSYVIPANATANYVAIMIEAANSSHTYNGVYIDDIEIDVAPTCFKPKNLAVTPNSITAHEASLTWQPSSNGTENAWVLQCCIDDEFMCGDAGIFVTTYYVRVKPDCDTEGALWSNVVSFTTAVACPAPTSFAVAENGLTGHTATLTWQGTSNEYQVSYRTKAYVDGVEEGFGTSLPTGWETKVGLLSSVMGGTALTTGSQWYFGTSNGVFDYHARINIYGSGSSERHGWLITPEFELPAGAALNFDMALTAYNGTVATPGMTGTDDRFIVLISTDNEATWAILREWNNSGSTYVYNDIAHTATGENVSIDLSSYAGQSVRIAFYGESTESNADNNLHIDNVAIGTPVSAGEMQYASNITEQTVTLSNLLAERKYEAWLQGDCGSEGPSAEVGPITFTTDIPCPKPTSLTYSNVKSTSVELRWVGHGEEAWLLDHLKVGDQDYITMEVSDNQVTHEEGGVIVYKLDILDPETEYCVKVRANCEQTYAGDGQSDYSNEECFTTTPSCAVENVTISDITHHAANVSWDGESADGFTVSYRTAQQIDGLEENFNGSSITWEIYGGQLQADGTATLSSASGWRITTYAFGNNNATCNIYGTNCFRWLVTPTVTLPQGSALNFDMALTDYGNSDVIETPTSQADDRFVVLVSTNGGTNWTILREWNNAEGTTYVYNSIATTGEHVNIDLSAYNGQTVKIAFYGESTASGGDNDLHIDNVTIGTPVAAGTWQTVSAANDASSATISGLTAGTKYDVKVAPNCDATLESEIVQFTTVSPNEKWFITEGNWGTASNWEPEGAPTINQNVTLMANAIIESTCVAEAKSINGTGTGTDAKTLTIKDGGKLKHLNSSVRATVEKEIRAYSTNYDVESYNNGDYYLIANPLTSNVTPDAENNHLLSGNYDLYNWDYTQDLEWRNYEASNFSLSSGAYGYLYANEAGATLTYTGIINPYTSYMYRYCSVASNPDNYDFPGWYLLGNPYLYDAYLATAGTNGNALPYIKMNTTGDGFKNVAAGTPIEPMEGFFYQATTSASVYVVTTVPTVQSGSKLNMNLRKGNKQLDNAILVFGGNQQLGKMTFRANSSKIFMPVEGKDYAITSVEGQVGEVPVSFKAESNGTYSLSFTSEEVSFSYLHLIDNMTGNDINLLQTPSYTFDARTSDYESRFRLVFATGSSTGSDTFGFVNASGNFCIFGLEGEATVQVIDVLGHVLSSEQFSGSYEKQLNVAPGVYMIRLIQGNDVKVQKVVVRR